jgi:hypothetical protein
VSNWMLLDERDEGRRNSDTPKVSVPVKGNAHFSRFGGRAPLSGIDLDEVSGRSGLYPCWTRRRG